MLSVLLIQKIARDVAQCVLEREQFLSTNERIVFPGVALDQAPIPDALAVLWTQLYRRWLGAPLSGASLEVLVTLFKQKLAAQGPAAAYQAVLALLLEHGGLYYI